MVRKERLLAEQWNDYELIDAGNGMKLERWGEIITIRPEVQAYFQPGYSIAEWRKRAHFEFKSTSNTKGEWVTLKSGTSENWQIKFKALTFNLELTKFKHLGLFPEQNTNWEFIESKIQPGDKFLNLFAYTGAASCVAQQAGAQTTHVDSVKQLITWARKNQEESHIENIRWIHEDALKFAEKEGKRGKKYKGIIMDPPAWGIGAKGQKWKLEQKLESLFQLTSQVLEKDGFLILNTYSPSISLKEIALLKNRYFPNYSSDLKELWMISTTQKKLYYGNLLRIG